jgi:hypothetical protein
LALAAPARAEPLHTETFIYAKHGAVTFGLPYHPLTGNDRIGGRRLTTQRVQTIPTTVPANQQELPSSPATRTQGVPGVPPASTSPSEEPSLPNLPNLPSLPPTTGAPETTPAPSAPSPLTGPGVGAPTPSTGAPGAR